MVIWEVQVNVNVTSPSPSPSQDQEDSEDRAREWAEKLKRIGIKALGRHVGVIDQQGRGGEDKRELTYSPKGADRECGDQKRKGIDAFLSKRVGKKPRCLNLSSLFRTRMPCRWRRKHEAPGEGEYRKGKKKARDSRGVQ